MAYDRSIEALKTRATYLADQASVVQVRIKDLNAKKATRPGPGLPSTEDPDPGFTDNLLLMYNDTLNKYRSEINELVNVAVTLANMP